MKKILPILILFSPIMFFSIYSILGLEYKGMDKDFTYMFYLVLVLIVSVFFYIFNLIKRDKFSLIDTILLTLPITFFIIFITSGYNIFDFSNNATKAFILFVLFSFPAIVLGIYFGKVNITEDGFKYIEYLMLIISISLTITVIIPFLSSKPFVSYGGSSYQNASYNAAIAFGLNIYFLVFGCNHKRAKFMNNRYYKIVSIVFIPIQLISIIISGGRGGMVLAFAYIVLTIFVIIISKKLYLVISIIQISVVIIFLGFLAFTVFSDNDLLKIGFERTFAFLIGGGGINWSGTSGRDLVYLEAWHLILEKPYFGYGLFSYYDASIIYPHNLFLEILLNGGFILLIPSVFFLVFLFYKFYQMLRLDIKYLLILYIALYPFILLMFSATYMEVASFWFFIAFVLTYRFNKEELVLI